MGRQVNLDRLMRKAAKGSRRAAKKLLAGGYWPYNPDNRHAQDMVMELAKNHWSQP